MNETAFVFGRAARRLVGILHRPDGPSQPVGVVVVVGGPQYRVGSHRQFVLLARALAGQGIATLRFDYCGMGDSDGEATSFEALDADIAGAVDELLRRVPQLRTVVLWGLCDGASAALMYASSDARVGGLVLLNPWVRTEAGLAKSYLWTYYPRRLLSAVFWRKVLARPQAVLDSVAGLVRTLRQSQAPAPDEAPAPGAPQPAGAGHFLVRMLAGMQAYPGEVTVLLSGNDITAGEFRAMVRDRRAWGRAFGRRTVQTHELADANHTFSSEEWRAWAADRTVEAVRSLAQSRP